MLVAQDEIVLSFKKMYKGEKIMEKRKSSSGFEKKSPGEILAWLLVSMAIGFAIAFALMIKLDIESVFWVMVIFVVCWFLVLYIIIQIMTILNRGKAQEEQEEAKKQKELQDRRTFYRKCSASGILECKTEAEKQKAMLIAQNCNVVISSNISDYFYETKKMFEQELSQWEKQHLETVKKKDREIFGELIQYEKYYGTEKRVVMLKDELAQVQKKTQAIRDSIKGMQLVYFEQEHDPYVHGGIASGIAGTGAGIVRALEIQQKNAEIRQKNAETAERLKPTIKRLEDQIWENEFRENTLTREINSAPIKLVSKDSPSSCLEKLAFSDTKIKITEAGSCIISVDVEMAKPMIIFEKIKGIVDGTIIAKVFDEDKCVGEASMVLPAFGIGYNEEKSSIKGIALFCAEKGKTYTVKYCESSNLWAMER